MSTYSVQFVGHVIQDEFTEYHMKVSSSDNISWLVRRRYREFRELHDHLKLKYPDRIPSVPGKKLWGNQDPEFVKERQDQLQVYMEGVLSVEPDCRTRVLQRFLEIKKPPSVGSPGPNTVQPVMQAYASSHAPSTTSSSIASATASAVIPPPGALQAIIDQLDNRIFDLSVTPSLLDAGEYAVRRKKYQTLIAKHTVMAAASTGESPSGPSDLNDPFEVAAWTKTDLAKSALTSVLGKAPIATENDLVAFFSLKPERPELSSSST